MGDLKDYIESGIIQSYVLGLATEDEISKVESLAMSHKEVQTAIDEFSLQLEKEVMANAVEPDPLIKPLLMATLDFMSRMGSGEQPSLPPLLHPGSKIEDYKEWLDRPNMAFNSEADEIYARLIAYNAEATTAIVWLKDMAPQEVHHNEYERFLIVEGTCEITIGSKVHSLQPGSFLEIPLHVNHSVKVTSLVPCKVILQRVAA